MYTLKNRVSAVFFYMLICLAWMSAFNWLTWIFTRKQPVAKFEFKDTNIFAKHPHTGEDVLDIRFDLQVDLTDIYDWNTYLLFAYLSVEYKNDRSSYNQVTFWDDIILRNETFRHNVNLTNAKSEYLISDIYRQFKGKPLDVYFNWEHMPIVGVNYKDRVHAGTIYVPDEYNTNLQSKNRRRSRN